MLLREYVTRYIKEAISYNLLNLVSKELNNITKNHKASNNNHHIYYDLVKVVDKFGLKPIGAGLYRHVYSIPEEDWVLKFAYEDSGGEWANAEEVAISVGSHGTGARDLFVKIFEWDKINENPEWIIAEKVITLADASRSMPFSVLKKIFPTFWDALYSDANEKTSVNFFCDFIADTLRELSIESEPGQNASGLNAKAFYISMKEAAISELNIMPFEAIKFNEDFYRIARACAYSRPDDMHSGNIGIVPSNQPNPKDIVILDYLIS